MSKAVKKVALYRRWYTSSNRPLPEMKCSFWIVVLELLDCTGLYNVLNCFERDVMAKQFLPDWLQSQIQMHSLMVSYMCVL